MAQAGILDVIRALPPLLVNNFATTSPVNLTLLQVRIMGDSDLTYGTAGGWVPPIDGSPWAVVMGVKTRETAPIPWEKLVKSAVEIFIAVDHSDTPALAQNYNAIALGWIDAARQFFPKNRRLNNLSLDPSIWDALIDFEGGDVLPAYPIFGSTWYGALLRLPLEFKTAVSYAS